MGMLDFISNTQETSEMHSKKEFRTRYYRCGYTKAKEAVVNFAEQNGYHLRDVNDTHGEIYIQTNKFHLMISIIQINPLETAIDIKSQVYRVLGFHKPGKLINEIYAELNSKLKFKGISLHR